MFSRYADGKDPDDYVRNHGGQALLKDLVAKAVKPLDYLLSESPLNTTQMIRKGSKLCIADVFPVYC